MVSKKQIKRAFALEFKPSVEPARREACKGYDFSKPFDLDSFLSAYHSTGFQATNLGKAIGIAKRMQEKNCRIFLGFTSNVASCGLREILAYLAKEKKVHVLVTTTGGIEEDVMKVHKPFYLGTFYTDDVLLRKKGINRTGNLFIPNERYIWFERVMQRLLGRLYKQQQKTGETITTLHFTRELGREMKQYKNGKTSYVYWAYKNNIPLFCPGLTDGAIGDNIYFFTKEHPDFRVDIVQDVVAINDLAIEAEKVGALIIGGSLPKHHIMNACLLREGTDYTVYLNTGLHEEGSDSGAPPEEAQSWGKANAASNHVKVWGEASITFPLLVAGAFRKEKKNRKRTPKEKKKRAKTKKRKKIS